MKRYFATRLVVLGAIGVTFVFGNVASAQTDPAPVSSGGVVVASIGAQPKPQVCEEPPCLPPPPPDQRGGCVLRIDGPRAIEFERVLEFAYVDCQKGNGDPLNMQHISLTATLVKRFWP